NDILNPDRIVIGEHDKKSGDTLEKIYQSFKCQKIRCDIKAAEIIKYASNSLLATKISFANEFSRICEKLNVDVYEVMEGVGLDFRINPQFLRAGVGFGGSCFPKDLKAIIALSEKMGVNTPILKSVMKTNEIQPEHFIDLIIEAIGQIKNKKIAFLGLSFKPDTDDVRETRALPIINHLYNKGAKIKAYDPQAIKNFQQITDIPIEYYDSWEQALQDSDCAVIQTEWKEVKEIKAEDFERLLKTPIVIDGRRTYDANLFISKGIEYYGIGWKNINLVKKNILQK
ncbi:MAG: UDP-glucose/GDP-mannose dehydrogenase family protein, partial [Thermoplasmata archaeon]